ncbi:MAG: prepilin-type N-terminal cleavage/methylation domain-containing protein [Gammaproteobacteria bacterium]|nr:prepilin-type N-terminal cleavage/methylation domain-containing protein [Gammaproteobacteria bacterium]
MKKSGFTLIELLVVVSIVAILTAIAIPFGKQFLQQQHSTNAQQTFTSMIQFAQQAAANENTFVSICPTLDHKTCMNDWVQEKIVFVGLYNKSKPDAEKKVLRIFPAVQQGTLKVGARGAKNTPIAWRFAAHDLNQNQNGSFTYCLDGVGWKIVINRLGRMRTEENTPC